MSTEKHSQKVMSEYLRGPRTNITSGTIDGVRSMRVRIQSSRGQNKAVSTLEAFVREGPGANRVGVRPVERPGLKWVCFNRDALRTLCLHGNHSFGLPQHSPDAENS